MSIVHWFAQNWKLATVIGSLAVICLVLGDIINGGRGE